MKDQIYQGDPLFNTLFNIYRKEQGTLIPYQGQTWQVIRDVNEDGKDIIYFARTGSQSGVDGAYGEWSVNR